MSLKVAVFGATGYSGAELLRLLVKHPGVEITAICSESYAGKNIGQVYPSFLKNLDMTLEKQDKAMSKADLYFLALPYGEPMKVVPALLKAGKQVIDLSGDFRLKDKNLYPQWYKFPHKAPAYLKQAVYGLPELYKEEIKKTSLVSNPGCFPTGAILSAAPLLKHKLIDSQSIILDAKTGVSGSGRKPALDSAYVEINENMKPYKVGGKHQHIPEMEQALGQVAGKKITLSFTPYLSPFTRGIFSTLYAKMIKKVPEGKLLNIYKEFYLDAPFVRVYEQGKFPDLKAVYGSNFCDMGLSVDARTGKVIVFSTIDNLGKGAAGQAVQNMNLMAGFNETAGLMEPGIAP